MRYKILILLAFLACCGGGDGSGSSSGPESLNRDEVTENPPLTLKAVYDYSHQSTCLTGDIHKEVLSYYTDKDQTRFELRKADGAIYLSGDLPETKVITYRETLSYALWDPVKKVFNEGSVEGDCYLEIQENEFFSRLHSHCRAQDPVVPINCHMYWY